MSDSFVLLTRMLSHDETLEFPRYIDFLKPQENNDIPQQSSEEIFSKFDKLRRKEE